MEIFKTKTTRELEALEEMETTLRRRQRRQRVLLGVAVATALLTAAGAVARAFTSKD
ncbi:MAG: hypothetical protein HDS56_09320 [Barnesiella sp.]|nr:hypothetical protein [Barnesiella sp.]MBD5252645.1 hypothetical protein [Barnesiella sp.]